MSRKSRILTSAGSAREVHIIQFVPDPERFPSQHDSRPPIPSGLSRTDLSIIGVFR